MSMLTPPAPIVRATLPQFVEELLQDQRSLTAVEQFAQANAHETTALQSRYYRSLLPADPPRPGEQYAFEVDLDRCSGCKACVTACHALNGLDDHETWRDVGLLIGGTAALPVIQHVTSACHHCVQPACMSACPTLAYEKDQRTGIVKHLDDQCFGCQYCILACPYEVPKYHHAKGIVRKCDMCSQRLAVGEAPACVQACPDQAIQIKVVSQADVIADCEADPFLPGAPDPQLTLPTTTYRTSRVFPRNLLPADYFSVRIKEAHFPLIVMLVLTQLSVGACFVNELLIAGPRSQPEFLQRWQAGIVLFFGLLALAASTLHLGRPHLAWRAILGLRTSWLSREIVAFGIFAGLATISSLGRIVWPTLFVRESFEGQVVRIGTLAAGLAGIFCSAMIYHWTRRPTWSGPRTFLRFIGTSLWLGLVATLFAASFGSFAEHPGTFAAVPHDTTMQLVWPLILCASAKLIYESLDFVALLDRNLTTSKRVAGLLTRELAGLSMARFALGVLGGVLLPFSLLAESSASSPVKWLTTVTAIFGMSIAAEVLERTLFFMTAVAPRMPGALRT